MTSTIVSIILAIVAIILAVLNKRNKKPIPRSRVIPPPIEKDKSIPDKPVSFGYKCLWFSVKTNNPQRVADILQLSSPEPCNWETGIHLAYEENIFISPAVDGWTFVIGWGLILGNTTDDIGEARKSLCLLSKEFGEAQYFCTHRISEYHIWMRAVNGEITRGYGYLGESGENVIVEGEPTDIEKKYNLVNTFSKEAETDNYFDSVKFPDEEMVMEVAGSWSVNPSLLDERTDAPGGLGLLYQNTRKKTLSNLMR